MKYSLHIFCALLLGAANLLAAPRTWTNLSGQQIEAELVELEETTVRLKLKNGSFYKLEIKQLSEADQAFLTEERNRLAEAAKTAELANHDGEWMEDWDKAKATAKELDMPILLLFTGSDWCPPCKALEANIFSSDAFKKFAKEELVLMKADFPRSANQRASVKKQNEKLKEEYPIGGYPTVYLLNSKLKELDKQVGFGGGSPEEYVKNLESKLK